MKLLFLTTLGRPIDTEHIFTLNVLKGLCCKLDSTGDELAIATIFTDSLSGTAYIVESRYYGKVHYQLHLSPSLSEEVMIAEIAKLFRYINPTIIHSNMTEVVDVAAAKLCRIPIVLTIHIGGFLCPRGNIHGFLKYDNSICDTKISKACFKCCAADLPLPALSRFLYWLIPNRLKEWAFHKLKGRQIFYLTQFLIGSHEIQLRLRALDIYRYATIIAANHRLKDLLALNGLTDNVILLPHGVEPRPQLPIPSVDDKVKLYYLGRMQYAKGLHVLLQALEGIDNSLYELHVIGDTAPGRKAAKYKERIQRLAQGKPVVFHGELPNADLESVIKDMHVMVHPTICMEVYGLTIAESHSIGRPVIATRCGGSEMQVVDGVNGWLVAPNDVKALHEKIIEVINHKEQIAGMGANCRLSHPIGEYVNRLTEIYTKL